jgi:hypothetical protein
LRESISSSKPTSEGGRQRLRRSAVNNCWIKVTITYGKPKYETQGWWYAPSEEVLGRECKSCSVFYELAEFAGTKRRKESPGQCRKCQPKEGQIDTPSARRKKKNASHKRVPVMTDESTLRRSERARAQERVEYREGSVECDAQSDSDHTKSNEPLSYGLKLRVADPRYITKSEDRNRGDIILTRYNPYLNRLESS